MFKLKDWFKKSLAVALLGTLIFSGCSSQVVEGAETVVEETETLTEAVDVKSNDMDPDYETVFNQNEVLEFNITIDSEDWATMQEDLATNLSQGGGNLGGQRGGQRGMENDGTEVGEMPEGMPPQGGAPGGMGGGRPPQAMSDDDLATMPEDGAPAAGGMDSSSGYDPVWVEASITFEDTTWDHVGIRFKGNSSLTSAYSSGNDKLSFKLDFDEFEDDYPETKNQRFYGFKQLNLNNNFSDSSLMREKVAADLFREFGLVSANTTFCIVNVDYGEGSTFYGVYTLVEEMDDTGLSQFADDDGNLYKPDGSAASFAEGSYDEGQMEKKTNEDENDYSDVAALYEIINSDLRTTDLASWKAELESVFNVDGFLKWLAANTVIQNWDTYGNMTHNYYLYNNPETGQLNWLPWDNNEAFSEGKGNMGALSFGMTEIGDEWPLISYIVDHADYKAVYEAYLQEFVDEVFTVEKMTETYNTYYEMIKDYAYAEEEGCTYLKSDAAFDQAVERLKTHVEERNEALTSYLQN